MSLPARPGGPSADRTGLPPASTQVFDIADPHPSYGELAMTDDDAMELALAEAASAADHGDVPVGAVVLVAGRVIAKRHNERERLQNPTAHAELLALADAAIAVGSWRLSEATLVVTLEPCVMCAGAAIAARLGRLVYGAADLKAGACGSLYNVCADPRLNHEVPVTSGVHAERCAEILRSFFANHRQ